MAFTDFTFPKVQQDLELTFLEVDLFRAVPPLDPPGEFLDRLQKGVDLALRIGTEKAKSEFIIAPLLLQLHGMKSGGFGLFSGVEFNVDPARKLNGYCDFILTRSAFQPVITAPVLAIAEAKNDNVRSGYGQCIAAMVAAREFNAAGEAGRPVYGASTTGTQWKFLQLIGPELTFDRREYTVAEPERLLGILAHIVGG